jgi:hypothetical protein
VRGLVSVVVCGSEIAGAAGVGGMLVGVGAVQAGAGSPPVAVKRDSALASQLAATSVSQPAALDGAGVIGAGMVVVVA